MIIISFIICLIIALLGLTKPLFASNTIKNLDTGQTIAYSEIDFKNDILAR